MISVRIFAVLATLVALVLGLVTDCQPESSARAPLPEIMFSADRDKILEGECTTLHWQVTDLREGDTVYLDSEQVDPSGHKNVCPTRSWTYFLQVEAMGETFHADDLRIEVVPIEQPPPEPKCTKDDDCCSDYAVEKCDEDDNCVAFECDAPKQCKEVCPGDWDCVDHVCVPWLGPPSEPGCSVDADCDAGVCDDGECAQAEPAPAPLPEEEQLLAHILGEFEDKFNAAYESGDPEKLYNLIHPASKRRYGDQCHVYTEYVIEGSQSIVIDELDIVGPETWNYETDGLSEPIDEVIRVGIQRTSQGETNKTYIHLGKVLELLYFFTDCGTPPTPTLEPEPEHPPEPADTTGPVISDPYPPDDYMGHCCIHPDCAAYVYPTDIPYTVTVTDDSGVLWVEFWWNPLGAGQPEQKGGDFARGEGNEWNLTWFPPDWVGPGLFPYSIHAADSHGNTSSSGGWTLGLFEP